MLNKDVHSYHFLHKALHWTTALMFFALLFVGFYMVSMPFGDDKFFVYAMHKSFGLLVLIFTGVRLFSLFFIRKPFPLLTHKAWEKFLSHAAHVFLYSALIMMPVSGLIMSSAGAFPVSFFGFPVPDITGKDDRLFLAAKDVHEIFALSVLIVLSLHIAGALKHHFIDRDETLARMTRRSFGRVGALVLTVLIAVALIPSVYMGGQAFLKRMSTADAEVVTSAASVSLQQDRKNWIIDLSESSVQFTASQYSTPFEGRFEKFDGDIHFDPQDLDNSYARIHIDVSSVKTGSADRDQQALSTDWFDVGGYPVAVFESTSFRHVQADEYVVSGMFDLRGVRVPLEFPFSLRIAEEDNGRSVAVMAADLTLSRLDFGIGQGQWQKTDAIADEVALKLSVRAYKSFE